MVDEERIEALRAELVELVSASLTPVAQRYGYSEVPLEDNVKWRPQVLILGNYSSGKSTLINELLGADIQATGQAPTDDSFTIITFDEKAGEGAAAGAIRVTEEREGSVLLNDPQYPFAALRRHGQRFAAHFRLKKVNAPFLRHVTLIDTPGMLDSVAERDRGYDYQQVIGDLAQIADLVLVMFDPHKAGTVREAHASLRETLPASTFEDRVLFVLNRVDECANLTDLLRVYGTLCWNLSQMLGRKDIPPIRMTWFRPGVGAQAEFLRHLPNERDEVKRQISLAPKYRLDHLAAFVETHGERLAHFLEALLAYRRERGKSRLRMALVGGGIALLLAVAVFIYGFVQGGDPSAPGTVAALLFALGLAAWLILVLPLFGPGFHRKIVKDLDALTPLASQSRRDTWEAVRAMVLRHLDATGGRYKTRDVRHEHARIRKAVDKGTKDVRAALNELATTRHG